MPNIITPQHGTCVTNESTLYTNRVPLHGPLSPAATAPAAPFFQPAPVAGTFTPETVSAEWRAMFGALRDFAVEQIDPANAAIEARNMDVIMSLVAQAAEMGVIRDKYPERLGGLGLDTRDGLATIMGLHAGKSASFDTIVIGSRGIGAMGLVLAGTPEVQELYLKDVMEGRVLAAYGLTEPGAGSDVGNMRTTAVELEDGSWEITGSKCYITNIQEATGNAKLSDGTPIPAGIMTVMARTAKGRISAFVVPGNAEGVSLGKLEDKMGLHGTSTGTVFFDKVVVPASHLLGEKNKGHVVALNLLNIGRATLAAGNTGECIRLINLTLQRAAETKAFGKTIDQYGLLEDRMASQILGTYAAESFSYHIAEAVDTFAGGNHGDMQALLAAWDKASPMAAASKFWVTEHLRDVVRHAMQIYGGAGYMKDEAIVQSFDDQPVYEIFEGTNEINRRHLVMATRAALLPTQGQGQVTIPPQLTMPPMDIPSVRERLRQAESSRLARLRAQARELTNYLYQQSIKNAEALRILQDPARRDSEGQFLFKDMANQLADLMVLEATINRATRAPEKDREIHDLLAETFATETVQKMIARARNFLGHLQEERHEHGDSEIKDPNPIMTRMRTLAQGRKFQEFLSLFHSDELSSTDNARRRITEYFSAKGEYALPKHPA